MFGDIHVEGERIALIPYSMEDVDDLYRCYSDPEVMKFIPEGNMSHEWVVGLIDFMVNHCYVHNTLDHIEKFGVSIRHKESGRVIGWCGLGSLDYNPSEIELFYGLNSEYWRQGYGYEAARLMLRYGFDTIGLKRIVALFHPDNIASGRIVEKLGMKFEGLTEVADPNFSGYNGEKFYAISSAEYKAREGITC